MKLSLPAVSIPNINDRQGLGLSREKVMERAGLAALVLLAALLRFANLDRLGDVNHYYTAAMVSMLKSWHNFFFLAAEPGGAVSVDKPPVGLWLQAASTAIFGVNSLGLLLPEILAGLGSVIVIYYLVRRTFGAPAGLIAALALAVTPIVIATDRNNTMDSLLILTLLLAAWAFIKAVETRRMRFLLLGAALVGLGFNIKMLEAFLPLPAFYALYLLGAAEGFWRKLGKLLLASVLLLVISLSWVTIVDLTPASQRPYIGSSGDNTETSLITGYNGMNRLLGMFGRSRGSQTGGPFGGLGGQNNNRSFPQGGGFFNGNGGFPNGNRGFQGNRGQPNSAFSIQGGNSGTASGSVDMGRTGWQRLFSAPLSKNASWLLPFGLVSALLLLAFGFKGGGHLRWSSISVYLAAERTLAVVLWGGWLLTAGVFFSIAGFFHEYYLAMLGAPLSALVGIGAGQFWQMRQAQPPNQRWSALILLPLLAAGTLAFQALTASPYLHSAAWLPYAGALFGLGAVLWISARQPGRLLQAGFTCLIAALLVAPGLWSALTNLYPSENQSLPSVYSGQTGQPPDLRGLEVDPALLDYLQANTAAGSYLLAVPSSMQGSDYVIATGRPVLYLGGFMGIDQVVTTDQLAQMVQSGRLRFIYSSSNVQGSRWLGGQNNTAAWVSANCSVVPGFDAVTQNAGAPRGIVPSNSSSGSTPGFGSMQLSLYDCGG